MLPLYKFLLSLFGSTPAHAPESDDEAYLGEAVDLCDLERRMRALDEQRRVALSGIAFGLYPR